MKTAVFSTGRRATAKFWIGCSLLLSLVCLPVDGRAILGIDLGSLYMKVALVRSGSPLEIVTNLHSKRKTEQMILFDQGQRFYGADAAALVQRKAQFTPCSMSEFLGRTNEHPNVQALMERHYPVTPTYNETRKGPSVKVPKAGDFTPEELVSMVLQHAVEISQAYAKEAGSDIPPPQDIVLTVPCYYTHLERKALLDAARLVNLNVLTLIDETTAAALHYAHDKNFEEEQVFLFYNMGAASLQVSIVKLFQYEQKQGFGKPKPVPALQVLSKTWDSTLGGLSWDHVLVEHLADQFNAKWAKGDATKDVRKFERAMTKIRLAANKAKHVLSANMEYPIQLFGLHDDVSLDIVLTRDEFETMTAPLLDRAIQPVLDALSQANMTTANLTGIELLGGGMRVPSIQTKLAEILAPVEIGLHMNADESMALGAAFAGANISTAFRVRPVGMTDLTPFEQQISLSNLQEGSSSEEGTGGWFRKFRKTEEKKKEKPKEGEEEEDWNKKATLFKAYSKVGVKKTIAFTHDKDVHCALDYVESPLHAPSTDLKLERYEVSGVAEFAKELQEKKLEGKPKVSLQFELLSSGITALVKAEASMEETYMGTEEIEVEDEEAEAAENATNATSIEEEKKEDGEKEEAKEEAKTDDAKDANETTADKDANETTDKSTEKPKEKAKDKKKKRKMKKITVEKEKKRVHKRTLKVSTYYEGAIQPHWDELFAASKAKLEEMDDRDNKRIMLEAAKNRVESYMFTVKNKLSDLEEELATVSTEEQREECRKLAGDAEMWLEDEGYDADLPTMEAKFIELSAPFEKILLRLKEKEERPVMIEKVEKILTQAEDLLKKWETTMPQVTEEEREKVKERIAAVRGNITELEELQAAKAPHEDPAYLSADLPPKLAGVESLMQRLSKKPKPKPVKKATNKTDADSINVTAADESETDLDADESTATSTDEPAAEGEATKEKDPKEEKEPSEDKDTKTDDKAGDDEL